MIQYDEKIYFYLLFIIPVVVVLFLLLLVWKKRTQKKFADTELLKRLTPNRSYNKGGIKLVVFILAMANWGNCVGTF